MLFTPVLGTFRASLYELIDLMVFCEELGYDGVWVTEHHGGTDGGRPSPITTLAYAAGRTERIRLGTAAVSLPLHHPLDIAEDLATLDVLSNGRVDAGFGRGLYPALNSFFNVTPAESRGRFNESLAFIIDAWTEPTAQLDGAFWTIPEINVLPKPVQKPKPAVWITALSQEAIDTCIAFGTNGLVGPFFSRIEDLKESHFDPWHQKVAAAGIAPGTLQLGHSEVVYVAETDEQAIEESRDHLAYHIHENMGRWLPDEDDAKGGPYAHYGVWKTMLTSALEDDALFRERTLIGSPDSIIAKLRFLEACGLTHFLPVSTWGTLPPEQVKRSLALFAEEVMPAFRPTEVAADGK